MTRNPTEESFVHISVNNRIPTRYIVNRFRLERDRKREDRNRKRERERDTSTYSFFREQRKNFTLIINRSEIERERASVSICLYIRPCSTYQLDF